MPLGYMALSEKKRALFQYFTTNHGEKQYKRYQIFKKHFFSKFRLTGILNRHCPIDSYIHTYIIAHYNPTVRITT